MHFNAALLVLEAEVIIRFGQVPYRLKLDFWLSFCLTKGKILASPSAALLLGLSFPFQQKKPWVACLQTEETCGLTSCGVLGLNR